MVDIRPGLVSVVLVNFRGVDDTLEALDRLRELDWPAELLEIVVVENGSGDDSLERLRAEATGIVLVESTENLGFAGGCNLGVSKSSGEIVAFLNNDAKPDAGWIAEAVKAFESSPKVGAVASRVLDWDGKLVDYVGAGLTWFGMGYKPLVAEHAPSRLPADPGDVLFGTGSAMFVRRKVYEELGGFDERFFMFFEDVDFGWRLNLRGWRFAYQPTSLAYHKHHASMREFGSFKEQYLLERNALFCLFKNAQDSTLANALPATLALAVRRSVAKGSLDSDAFDLRKPGGDREPEMPVPKVTMSGVFAVDQFVEALPWLWTARNQVQSTRVVPDARLWPLFGEVDMPAYENKGYLAGYENLVTAFPVTDAPSTAKVLIITGDPIGERMAGPAIRAWNMAAELSRRAPVRLLSLSGIEEGFTAPFELAHVRPGDDAKFAPHEDWADVIIFQGHAMAVFGPLRRSSKFLVVDIYDPMHLEQLEQGKSLGAAVWAQQVSDATEILNEQLERGDFFLCASERQRLFWLGQLAALGRINPANYENDPDLARLIAVVPFGLPAEEPVHDTAVLKGVVDGIGADDKVLLWGGGLYDWFDPRSLIRAVGELAERRPEVRLYFQGTKHPHPGVPEMPIVAESRTLAAELGLLDRNVFFNESWVPYGERQNYLLEADAGVSTHFAHVETTFSFRTRILDYLWAELPMVVTRGDHFGDLVAREGLGIAVAPEDVPGLAAALETVLFDATFASQARDNIRRVREEYRWARVLAPLIAFVDDPRAAGDRGGSSSVAVASRRRPPRRHRSSGLRHDLKKSWFYLRNGGPAVVWGKVTRRLGRS